MPSLLFGAPPSLTIERQSVMIGPPLWQAKAHLH
jgi:hypothetical protein